MQSCSWRPGHGRNGISGYFLLWQAERVPPAMVFLQSCGYFVPLGCQDGPVWEVILTVTQNNHKTYS